MCCNELNPFSFNNKSLAVIGVFVSHLFLIRQRSWVNSGQRCWRLKHWTRRSSRSQAPWRHSCFHWWSRWMCRILRLRSPCKWRSCCWPSSWHWRRRGFSNSDSDSLACRELMGTRKVGKVLFSIIFTVGSIWKSLSKLLCKHVILGLLKELKHLFWLRRRYVRKKHFEWNVDA